MKYVYVTKNTQEDIKTMNGYIGTTLLHTDPDYLVWLWINPVQADVQATHSINPSVNVIAMTMINVIKE
jgi:hypothetical protein